LIPHGSGCIHEPADIPNRHDLGHLAIPSSPADQSGRNRVYHAAHVQKVEEPPKRVEMAVVAINGEISLH
jgi:hypothetical protein